METIGEQTLLAAALVCAIAFIRFLISGVA
jgi:hypothetical protein